MIEKKKLWYFSSWMTKVVYTSIDIMTGQKLAKIKYIQNCLFTIFQWIFCLKKDFALNTHFKDVQYWMIALAKVCNSVNN